MADTAHKTEKEVVEHTESPEVVESKLDTLAAMMTAARNPIAWTGAGVSTSAGIPDFRGPNGKWTRAAQGKKPTATALKATTTLSATPTATHRSIVELLRTERLKFLISTNTDGLHRRSGVPGTKIAELHGNSNRVRCADCGAVAFLDDRTRTAPKAHDHDTPWKCFRGAACKPTMKKPPLTQQQREAAAAAAARPKQQSPAVMMDTIINFCEYLEDHVQSTANAKSEKADLLLVLGTSLRVITCDALESIVANRGKLIIVNKQITPYDDDCALRIFADCDAVMPGLMKRLGLCIPPVTLVRKVRIVADPAAPQAFAVAGIDEDSKGNVVPNSFIKCASLCLFQQATSPATGTLPTPKPGAKMCRVGASVAVSRDLPWAALALPKPSVESVLKTVAAEAPPLASGEAMHVGVAWSAKGHREEPPCVIPLGPVTSALSAGALPKETIATCTLTFDDAGVPDPRGWSVHCSSTAATAAAAAA